MAIGTCARMAVSYDGVLFPLPARRIILNDEFLLYSIIGIGPMRLDN